MTGSKKALSLTAGILIELISLALVALAVLIIVPSLIPDSTTGELAIAGIVANIAGIGQQVGAMFGLNVLLSNIVFFAVPAVITQAIAINYIYVKHKYRHGLAIFGVVVSLLLFALVCAEVVCVVFLLNIGFVYYSAVVPFLIAMMLLVLYVCAGNKVAVKADSEAVALDDANSDNGEIAEETIAEDNAEQTDSVDNDETAEPLGVVEETVEEVVEEAAEEITEDEVDEVAEEAIHATETISVEETIAEIEEPTAEEVIEEVIEESIIEEVAEEKVTETAEQVIEETTLEEVAVEIASEETPIKTDSATIVEVSADNKKDTEQTAAAEPQVARKQLRKRVTAKQLDEVTRILKWQSSGYLTAEEGQTMINMIMYGEDK